MDSDDGAQRCPCFRDFDESGNVRHKIVLAPEQSQLRYAVDDLSRAAALTIEFRCDRNDRRHRIFPHPALNLLLALV